jgi:hypothetical protein
MSKPPDVREGRESRDKYLEISLMNATEQVRFNPLYESMRRALKLQGKAKATKDAYSRAVRRTAEYFDRCPDDLSAEELRILRRSA